MTLIRREDAIEAVAQQWLFEASADNPYVNDDDIGEYRKLAEELFEDVPSAEAVDVVRCKDCRYFKKIVERSDSGLCYRDLVASAWKENGYCSRGERKGGSSE